MFPEYRDLITRLKADNKTFAGGRQQLGAVGGAHGA